MGAATFNLVIDARPCGPQGPFTFEVLLGRTLLSRLLEQALKAVGQGRGVGVIAASDRRTEVLSLLKEASPDRIAVLDHEPPGGVSVVRTDRLYDERRLVRAVRRGVDPEAAAFWRLDRPAALAGAEQELNRRLNYQPLGRYWAFPIADRLASALAATRVSPNLLTMAAGMLMLLGTVAVGCGEMGLPGRIVTAAAFAAALVLDTADGRLARLQGTCTALGRWLDQVLDELADLSLHCAVSWAAFVASGSPTWLLLGLLFVSGKYMFLVQSLTGEELEKIVRSAPSSVGGQTIARPIVGILRKFVGALGHADLRWHLWIGLALVGRLDAALAVYALYFPSRAMAGIIRKGVAHA